MREKRFIAWMGFVGLLGWMLLTPLHAEAVCRQRANIHMESSYRCTAKGVLFQCVQNKWVKQTTGCSTSCVAPTFLKKLKASPVAGLPKGSKPPTRMLKNSLFKNQQTHCARKKQYLCDNGKWKPTGKTCAPANSCIHNSKVYPGWSFRCEGSKKFQCKRGTWATAGMCACSYNGKTYALEEVRCTGGRGFKCVKKFKNNKQTRFDFTWAPSPKSNCTCTHNGHKYADGYRLCSGKALRCDAKSGKWVDEGECKCKVGNKEYPQKHQYCGETHLLKCIGFKWVQGRKCVCEFDGKTYRTGSKRCTNSVEYICTYDTWKERGKCTAAQPAKPTTPSPARPNPTTPRRPPIRTQ